MRLGDILPFTNGKRDLVLETDLGLVEDFDICNGTLYLNCPKKVTASDFLDLLEDLQITNFSEEELGWAIEMLQDRFRDQE